MEPRRAGPRGLHRGQEQEKEKEWQEAVQDALEMLGEVEYGAGHAMGLLQARQLVAEDDKEQLQEWSTMMLKVDCVGPRMDRALKQIRKLMDKNKKHVLK